VPNIAAASGGFMEWPQATAGFTANPLLVAGVPRVQA